MKKILHPMELQFHPMKLQFLPMELQFLPMEYFLRQACGLIK